MRGMVWLCMLVALLSLIVGTICSFGAGIFLERITPRALLILSGVSLLFGINFALLGMLKK